MARITNAKDITVYSVYGFKHPNERADDSVERCEHYKTVAGAIRYAETLKDTYYCVVIRKDDIFLRDENNEFSASAPHIVYTYGRITQDERR